MNRVGALSRTLLICGVILSMGVFASCEENPVGRKCQIQSTNLDQTVIRTELNRGTNEKDLATCQHQ